MHARDQISVHNASSSGFTEYEGTGGLVALSGYPGADPPQERASDAYGGGLAPSPAA